MLESSWALICMPSGAAHIAQMSTTLSAAAQWAAYQVLPSAPGVLLCLFIGNCCCVIVVVAIACSCATLLNWRVKKRAQTIAIWCVGDVVAVGIDVVCVASPIMKCDYL